MQNGSCNKCSSKVLEPTLLEMARSMALSQLEDFELKTAGENSKDNLEKEIEIGKDTSLYKLYNTNLHEKIAERKEKEKKQTLD